jgi:hypothetical protein
VHQEKLEQLHYEGERIKEEQELEQCTFHPHVNDFSPERLGDPAENVPRGYEVILLSKSD